VRKDRRPRGLYVDGRWRCRGDARGRAQGPQSYSKPGLLKACARHLRTFIIQRYRPDAGDAGRRGLVAKPEVDGVIHGPWARRAAARPLVDQAGRTCATIGARI